MYIIMYNHLRKELIRLLLIMGIIVGIILPIQTSINSKFRFKVGSPYLATVNSLVGGTLFLIACALIMRQPLWITSVSNNHWWLYLGGIMGAFAFTVNILLLPRLGAVQTVIMPLLGQIVMSMLIDNFGWFNLPVSKFNLIRLIGIVALLAGVLLVVYQKEKRSNRNSPIPWQVLGILAGFALAIQTASNGALGKATHFPITAGIFSMFSGAIIMIVVVGLIQRNLTHLTRAIGHGNRWWIWIGGPLGALYLLGSLLLAPIIGAGTTIVLTILGNIVGGLIIDKYGLIGTPKRPVGLRQYTGLVVMIGGIALIKLF